MFKVSKNVWAKFIKSNMFYSESEADFFNFTINSLSNSESKSEFDESESESDFSSVFINLDICIFFALYLRSSK